MSAYSQKSDNQTSPASTRTNFAPGERPLYFNNHGLFSDPFLAYHLPELEKKSAKDAGSRYLNKYWNEPTYEGYTQFNLVYAQMLSMWDQYAELLPDYNEAQLEERWIKPILKLLGWTYEVQDGKTKRAKRNVPDYSLFSNEQDYIKAKKTNTDEAYFEHVVAVADAKAWKLALDGIGRTNNNPSYQIVRYMEHAGVQWSILTNGRFWRLYSTRSTSKHATYYEVDLESLLAKRDDERFKYFYNFFRREAFLKTEASQQCFLDVVFENGVYYAKDVEENLKRRVYEVVENIARGFLGDRKGLSESELREVYEHSLYYLFRLMFILNCESKGLLAVDKTSDYFEYSLRKLITNLKAQYDGNHNWSSQYRTYGLISDLFELLAKGDERIGVHGFGNEVFASGSREFFKRYRIQDHNLNPALVQLACDYSEDSDELQFIDYKRLSEDHLGSLFEGLLEYHLRYAPKKMAVTKTGKLEDWSDLTEKQRRELKDSVIESGQAYLESSSGERKTTGSYYTPSNIVDYICKNALSSVVKGKTNREILKLRILDPAMGSAHFLIGAVRFLEETMLENVNIGDESLSEQESEKIRWMILHNCVFGIDINPLAVELAKFSLWIYTAKSGFELEPLSDQLLHGNALLDAKERDVPTSLRDATGINLQDLLGATRGGAQFDVVLGNPPYAPISEKTLFDFYSNKFKHQDYQLDLYLLFLERYAHFLKPGGRLGIIVSNTWLQSVKLRKIREYLCTSYRWDLILHSEDKIFDATVDTHALIFTLEPPSKEDTVKVEVLKQGKLNPLHELSRKKIPANGDPVNILTNEATSEICEGIKSKAFTVSHYFDVVTGVKPFQKGKGKPAQTAEILEKKPFVVEGKRPTGADWKPLMRGSLIHRYRNFWDNDYWIKYGPWLAEPRDSKYFEAPSKITVRQTGDSIIATLIKGGTVARDNLYLIVPKDDGPEFDLQLALGILNSKLVDFFYYNMNPEKGEALAQVKRTHVAELPLPRMDKLTAAAKAAGEKIKKLAANLLASKTIDEKKIEEIDELVFEMFGVSGAERKAILAHAEKFSKPEKKDAA